MTDCFIIYITVESAEEAHRIGKAAVTERLAACANILDPMSSIYWWQGKIEQGHETVLLLKTTQSRLDRLMAKVKELHSYACPCIVALPIDSGFPEFLRWIAEETR